jgi:hypothetical protein
MNTTLVIVSILFVTFLTSTLLVGCTQQHSSTSHVSDADYNRYAKKYPKMGESVNQGRLTKDSAYALRNFAPQEVIMDQYMADIEKKSTEINAKNISATEKHRLIVEYIHNVNAKYVDAANAAGKRAAQETSGASK